MRTSSLSSFATSAIAAGAVVTSTHMCYREQRGLARRAELPLLLVGGIRLF